MEINNRLITFISDLYSANHIIIYTFLSRVIIPLYLPCLIWHLEVYSLLYDTFTSCQVLKPE